MKKSLIITFIVLGILCTSAYYLFIPHKVESAILVQSNSKNTKVYLNGKKHTLEVSNLKYPANSVISYKYNYFKPYGFTVVKPIKNRIMTKDAKGFEIESVGVVPLSKKVSYYKLNKTNIEPCGSSDLPVGKNNVQTFKDSKGHLSTFIISPPDYFNTRIGISNTDFTSTYHDKVQLISTSSLKLYSLAPKYSETIPPNTLINIDKSSKGLLVTINNVSKYHLSRLYLNGGNIKIPSIKRGTPAYTPEYTGTLEFKLFSKGVCIVNELSVEDYLKKVIPSQMYTFGGEESLKCQAIVSRTNAISDMFSNKFQSLGFYVDDSTKSQIYNNASENTPSNNAITSTKGLIMTYNKTPIDAKYFYTSCGTGVRYEDVWVKADGTGDAKPYFRTVNFISAIGKLPENEANWLSFYKNSNYVTADTPSPYFRWNIKISEKGLSSALNKTLLNTYNTDKDFVTIMRNGKFVTSFPKLGNLKDILIINRSRGGNVISTKLVFENAEVILLGDSTLSSAFKFNKEYTGEDTALIRLNSTPIVNPSNIPSKFFSIEKTGGYYTIYGGGLGHGVGMSQYGAMELSKKNWDYKNILNVYYKNVSYTNLY